MLTIARYLVWIGLVMILLGGAVYLLARAGISFGSLPGDFRIERNNLTCVIALGTSLLLSILLTVILNILARIANK